MPNRSPRLRHPPAAPRGTRSLSHRSPAGLSPARRRIAPAPLRLLPRSSSEPGIWTTPAVSDGQNEEDDGGDGVLPRHYTCTDICPAGLAISPSTPESMEGSGGGGNQEGKKVVVSVTVEGSPGPVRAMVRLGASVGEAIGAVVDAYGREGRSPKLNPSAVGSLQLHHSHFCLQSLNKADTLGQVGGRSFYLRRNGGGGGAAAPALASPSTHRFLSIIARVLSRIGRRMVRLWRALGCASCG